VADELEPGDAEMTRLLRDRLTRHPAPPAFRASLLRALEPAPPRRWWTPWFTPALSALATAMVMLLLMAQSLPSWPTTDPLQPLARAVITEHARTLSWGHSEPEVVSAALPRIMDESGVVLKLIFLGDEQLRLMGAHPTYLEGHRGISLGYEAHDGHSVTYVMIPGGAVTLPDRGRVQIDRWRPLVRREEGFSLILWKQQGLLCALISDLVSDDDLARLKQYFVKLRASTEFAPTF
jgi:hypothetical protein